MTLTLANKSPVWLNQRNTDDDISVSVQCRLVRNLADFPFTNQCSPADLESVLERVRDALDKLNLLDDGTFHVLDELTELEVRLLLERGLMRAESLQQRAAGALYVSQDEGFSIAVNEVEHLVITTRSTGLQLNEAFTRASRVDDLLTGLLDFSFDERRGYLTSQLSDLGTGLRSEIYLHLPALIESSSVADISAEIEGKHHGFHYAGDPTHGTAGDLYRLTNSGSLGRSEEEFLYHIKLLANDLIERERHQRNLLQTETPIQLDDRIFRAQGLAQKARLLAMNEGLEVLSSLRLGHAQGLLQEYSLQHLNEVSMTSQSAHLELRHGQECDELTLSASRADLFRTRFA